MDTDTCDDFTRTVSVLCLIGFSFQKLSKVGPKTWSLIGLKIYLFVAQIISFTSLLENITYQRKNIELVYLPMLIQW